MNEVILQLAREQGFSPDSLKKWRHRKSVPFHHRVTLMALAASKGINLDVSEFGPARAKAKKPRKAKKARAA